MTFQAYLDNIEDKTGLTPRQFIDLAHERGLDAPGTKAGAIVDWLAADYSLGRGHADGAGARDPEGIEDQRQARRHRHGAQ